MSTKPQADNSWKEVIEISPAEEAFIGAQLDKGVELEVRFGRSSSRGFIPGVTSVVFKRLLRILSGGGAFTSLGEIEYLKISSDTSALSLLLSDKSAITAYCQKEDPSLGNFYGKQKVDKYDNSDYSYRLSLSVESSENPAAEKIEVFKNSDKFYRYMRRYSFKDQSGSFRFDLSLVKSSRETSQSVLNSRVFTSPVAYEVEIEYVGKSKKLTEATKKDLYKAIYLVLKFVQDTEYPMSLSRRDTIFEDYVEAFWHGRYDPADLTDRKSRFFLGAMPHTLTLENVIPLDVAAQDVPNIRRPYPADYTVTEKADGERNLLFVASDGFVFFLSRDGIIMFTGLKSEATHTLLDGEFVRTLNKYLAFDMLYNSGRDVRNLPLMRSRTEMKSLPPGRMEVLTTLLAKKPFKSTGTAVSVAYKRHFKDVDTLSKARDIWSNRQSEYKHDVDGIFFTARAAPYPRADRGVRSWDTCLKWKPSQLLSIDFQVFARSDIKYAMTSAVTGVETIQPYKLIHLFVSYGQKGGRADIRPFAPEGSGAGVMPYVARINLDDKNRMLAVDPISGAMQEFKDRDIVEFSYNRTAPTGYHWQPLRLREDKLVPNAFRTAAQVWEVIHQANGLITDDKFFDLLRDKINEKVMRDEYLRNKGAYYANRESLADRRQSDIYNLRTFHGYVKGKVIVGASKIVRKESEDDTVSALLDLGCGKGGDYFRYREAAVERVYAIDPDKAGLDFLLREMHDKNKRADKLPKVVLTFQADMTRLLSDGAAGETSRDRKILQETFSRIGSNFFPLVSCQFAIHYAFKDEVSMKTLMLNLYENLKQGGYFVGTALDGQKVFDLLQNTSTVTFGTETSPFAVLQKAYDAQHIQPFGLPIDVTFKTISIEPRREYLVDFEVFCDTLSKVFDINLVSESEAEAMSLPKATGTFEILHNFDSTTRSQLRLTDQEKRWSFLNRYFVFKKTGTGDGAQIQRMLKQIRQATK